MAVMGLHQQVERVTGQFELPYTYIKSEVKTITRPNGDTFTRHNSKIEHGVRTVTEGYMVYFPRGHSIFVAMDDAATIAKLGLDQDDQHLVEYAGEGGILQGADEKVRSPKAAVQASLTRRGGRQGGLSELTGDNS